MECAVGLEIVFINYIDPQLIAHLQKVGIRRIVAGANCVYVVFFAKAHISGNLIQRHGVALRRTGIVMIDTFEFDQMIIDVKSRTIDPDIFEANAQLNTGRRGRNKQIIENRLLGIPLRDFKVIKRNNAL